MRGSRADIPAVLEADFGTIRAVEWGGMNAELGTFQQEVDPAPFFKGLPDDRCQCPHWGYVVRGQMRYRFADHEEVYDAGDVYYVPPGHTPVIGEGSSSGTVVCTRLCADARNMVSNGLLAQHQFLGNLAITLASRNETQHFDFPCAQPGRK